MSTTTFLEGNATLTYGGRRPERCSDELMTNYDALVNARRMSWTEHHQLSRLIGSGGQGLVYLSERKGTDGFTLPVALKIFSPERFEDVRAYDNAMQRIANVAARVAQIQQDNLLDVFNFIDRNRIRVMEMEWIDGYDLSRLLDRDMLSRTQDRVSISRWEYLNRVIVTDGPAHPRLMPGIAIAIVRECLAGLAALHRENVIHGDIKPSNIMVKRTGNAKIIDIGSAFTRDQVPLQRTCTPSYTAPEVLEGQECSPQSDLASLGYVLIEMLAGQPVFPAAPSFRELLESKRLLPQRLPQILPCEVTRSELLMNFCRGLIAPDPTRRFPTAEAADLVNEGAANFQRQLVIGGLASEYENEIRLWLEELE